ncbi:MAG: N-acetyltransferase [Ghiorsea sp.]
MVEGDRSTVAAVKKLITSENTHVLTATIRGAIAACICIEKDGKQAYIGTFAVDPSYQNQGIGKRVLTLAENYAANLLACEKFSMVVISQREELISFYERRGYQRTGKLSTYPDHLNIGTPVAIGLTIECLEKVASQNT